MTPNKALATVCMALAAAIAPPEEAKPSDWAGRNLIVADGPRAGQPWDSSLTPYLPGILDCLAPDAPYTRVVVKKSAQTGLTTLGIAWQAFVVAMDPARMMVVFPTINAVQDFNRDKLAPTIVETPVLRARVREQKSRSSGGSTALNKKFAGGGIVLTGANSAADLRSKTVKYAYCDEVDEWPLDLDGQGDPMEMVDARQISFHATGDFKKLETSTPTIKGASRIDAGFAAGDQRYWHVPCPHCGERQRLEFGGPEVKHGLKFSTSFPYNAHYVCKHCGGVIEEHQKRAMVQAGMWVATHPGPGRHPSFHVDSLISLLTTWEKVAETFVKSKDDPASLKAFVNLWLGEAWEERGDAPEWSRLYGRRLDYPMRTIPAGGLVITLGGDVQGDGIYYETVAWGAMEIAWSVDWGFLPGDTGAAGNKVWQDFDAVLHRQYLDAFGNRRPIDLAGIDSGYNTEAVYEFVRRHVNVLALKGLDGWGRPAIATATDQDVNWRGKKKRRGLKVWGVGTWALKGKLYANLRKEGARDGAETDPPGYCHFSEFHDEGYFKQLTAEYLKDETRNGRTVRKWMASGSNHLHDCRVYNMAIAAHPLLGLPYLTVEDWLALARKRNAQPQEGQVDVEGLWSGVRPPDAGSRKTEIETAAAPDHQGGGSGSTSSNTVRVRGGGRVVMRGG